MLSLVMTVTTEPTATEAEAHVAVDVLVDRCYGPPAALTRAVAGWHQCDLATLAIRLRAAQGHPGFPGRTPRPGESLLGAW